MMSYCLAFIHVVNRQICSVRETEIKHERREIDFVRRNKKQHLSFFQPSSRYLKLSKLSVALIEIQCV